MLRARRRRASCPACMLPRGIGPPRPDAIRRVKFVSPSGPFSFDERQNAITNLYIREVRRVDGRIQNVTLDAIPGVKTPY